MLSQAQESTVHAGTFDMTSVSLMQLLLYGNFRMLFTGDAEGELYTGRALQIGPIDVLKVAHPSHKRVCLRYTPTQSRRYFCWQE